MLHDVQRINVRFSIFFLIKGCTDDVKELKEKTFAVKEKETVCKKDNKVD